MRTIVELDEPDEIAALFGAGFTLVLANKQEIVVKARGDLVMSDGELQVVFVKVRGASDTVQKAIDTVRDIINNGNAAPAKLVEHEPAAIDVAPPALPMSAVGANNIRPGTSRAKAKPTPLRRPPGGSVPCSHCEDKFVTPAGLSSHMRSAHPDELPSAKPTHARTKEFQCRHEGCDYQTEKPGWLKNHLERAHGGRAAA